MGVFLASLQPMSAVGQPTNVLLKVISNVADIIGFPQNWKTHINRTGRNIVGSRFRLSGIPT